MEVKKRLETLLSKEMKKGLFSKEIFPYLDEEADEVEMLFNILIELGLGVKISGDRLFVPSLISEPPKIDAMRIKPEVLK